MAVSISLNGTSLQTSNYVVHTLSHDGNPQQALNLAKISRRDGAKLISSTFEPKSITLAGTLKASGISDLEAKLDTLKKVTTVINGLLDIEYAGGVRRYTVSTISFSVERRSFHLSFVPFSIVFQVYDPPFGRAASSLGGNLSVNETLSLEAQTTQAIETTVSFDGSAPPTPRTVFVIDKADNIKEIQERVIGQKNIIVVGTAFTSGDRVVIDAEGRAVLWNGRPVNYEGVFPEYKAGDSTLLTLINPRESSDMTSVQQITVHDFVKIEENTLHVAQGFEPDGSNNYFQFEIYARRDVNTTTGTLRLRIDQDTTDGSHATPQTNFIANATVSVNVTDIPIDGGWIRFKFAAAIAMTQSSVYYATFDTSGLNGPIYLGIAKGDFYQGTFGASSALGAYWFSPNAGTTWQSDLNIDLAFRLFRSAATTPWSISKKVDYTKRYY